MKTTENKKNNQNKVSKDLIPFFKKARSLAKKTTKENGFGIFHLFEAFNQNDHRFQQAIYHAVLLESHLNSQIAIEMKTFKLKEGEESLSDDVKYLAVKHGSNKDEFIIELFKSPKIAKLLSDSYAKMDVLFSKYSDTSPHSMSEMDSFFGQDTNSSGNSMSERFPIESLSFGLFNKESGENNEVSIFTDLTEEAREGNLPKIIGREKELQEIYQILQRKTKSNPVVLGESGVGKTAIIHSLAQNIASGNCPLRLKNSIVLELKLSSLLSGTQHQGSLEKRLDKMLQYIKTLDGRAIVFIDDIHNIMSAKNAQMPLADLIRPFMARADFPVIGASTLDKYSKIEEDVSIARYFQTIGVEQPSVAETISILRGLRSKFEAHHDIKIEDNAIIQAVKMSDRYITDRHFPDKAIDVIDEAASIVKISIDSKPADIINIENKIKQKRLEKASVSFDGSEDSEIQMNNLNKEILILQEEEVEINKKLTRDYKIRDKIAETKLKINNCESGSLNDLEDGEELSLLKKEYQMLKDIEFEVLVQNLTVTEVLKTVAKKSGIPLDKMRESDKEKVLGLANRLNKKLIGQPLAVNAVSRAIKRSAAGMSDPERPIGSFLFLGSSGVGKTELCKQLAFEMFGTKDSIIRMDMSEYQEKHMLSKLIGSPQGYEGNSEGGMLTNEVRKKPYSIVLFDEIEKAHPDILNILLQILDEGHLTDAKGIKTNFKNTIIVLTSNIGSEHIKKNNAKEKEKVIKELEKKLRPELINRIDERIVFDALTENSLIEIAKLMIKPVIKQLEDKRIELVVKDECFSILIKDACDARYGARPLKRKIQSMVDDRISDYLLDGFLGKGSKIELGELNGHIQLVKTVEY